MDTHIDESIFNHSVHKYIEHCKKTKHKHEILYPKVMEIFESEIKNVEWMDDCFLQQAMERLKGAHISQLSSFYCRYSHSTKKTVFFQRFLRDEL